MNYVMIIDDSNPDQFLSKLVLEENNPSIRILQAYDGLEALEILEKEDQQPEVIFLDINMPRMNGHEFLEAYDKKEKCGSVVVMLSSSDQNNDKEMAFKHTCVKKYLVKPLTEESIEEVNVILSQKQNG